MDGVLKLLFEMIEFWLSWTEIFSSSQLHENWVWVKVSFSVVQFVTHANEKKIATYRLPTGGGLAERPLRGILFLYFSLFNFEWKYHESEKINRKLLENIL